ncbi:MAG: DUF624 domain-containing protein [Lachnospiraceae bacterium]|nr:DUF624 domain-containing protein [Lachnospiraceae bacterium]
MGGLFSGESGIGKFLHKTGVLVILSVIWFFTSLPIITLGASTTALYYTIVKCLRMDRGYMLKEYFKSWKQNFIKATIITVILAAILLLAWSYSSSLGLTIQDVTLNGIKSRYADNTENFMGLYITVSAAILFIGVIFCYIFPLLSRFDLNVFRLFATSFVFAIRYIPYSLTMLVFLVLAGILVLKMPMFIMFAPGLWCLIISFIVEKPIKKITPEPSPEEDAWWMRL